MGGPGPGHKSEKARRSQRANIARALAAAPPLLPWRSGIESRLIEQLVWQWWLTTRAPNQLLSSTQNQSPFASAIPSGARAPRFAPPNPKPPRTSWRKVPVGPDHPWPLFHVARLLGVSHTWIYTLIKRFKADPDRFRRRMAAFAPATYDKLLQAREETRRQRGLGWLRPPIRSYRIKRTLQGRRRTLVVPTKAEMRRRQGLPPIPWLRPIDVPYADLPAWARGVLPHLHPAIAPLSLHADTAPPVHVGTAPARRGMMPPAAPHPATPRPVPFAFRRRPR